MPYTIDIDDKQKRDITKTINNIKNVLTSILKDLNAKDIDTLTKCYELHSADNETRQAKNSYHLIFPNIVF
jgi:hypothetical protein